MPIGLQFEILDLKLTGVSCQGQWRS